MSSFKIHQKTLPSGLRTVLLPRAETDVVTFLVLIGVGSRYETPRQSGLSHFLEHMFFKGTEKRPTTKEIAEAIENIGGEFNAFTGEEYTGYYVKVAAKHLKRGADVVSDILLRPLFPKEEIERERGVIVEEIKMYTDMPMRHIWHLWSQALYGTHPLGRRIDGSAETVMALARRDFVDYTAQHYHTGNAVVNVAGNFDRKETEALLTDLLTDLSPGDETHPRPAPRRGPAERIVIERRDSLDQTHLMIGVPGVSLQDDERWAAEVLAIILGGGMSSRLFLNVRERNGLAYAVRTHNENYTDSGAFVTQAGVRTDKALQALKLILEEYDRIMNEPVEEAELKKAKQMIRGQLVLNLEETNALALFAGTQELLEKSVLRPQDMLKAVEAVTADDVQKIAQRLLKSQRRAAAVLGPRITATKFEKLLH